MLDIRINTSYSQLKIAMLCWSFNNIVYVLRGGAVKEGVILLSEVYC